MPPESPIHGLDARVKILATMLLILVCVSTPPTAMGAFGGYLILLILVFVLSNLPIRRILLRCSAVLPFVAVTALFIPFLRAGEIGGGYSLGIGGMEVSRTGLLIFRNVLVKSSMAVLAMVLLSETTGFGNILRALEQMRVPKSLIMLAGFTHRYFFVLRDEALRMQRACRSRGYRGRWIWQAGVIGRLIAALFLRGYERGERVYVSMVSRGFEGRPVRAGSTPSLPVLDCLVVSVAAVWILLFRWVAG
jgi:cobalt/nickel transport system permease protein